MIKIINKTECCGCEACASKCPKSAISMNEDVEGFFYPKVNVETCVDCGICDKVCPMSNSSIKNPILSSYALQASDEIRRYSASGGAFYSIASQTILHGGVVFGAAYDENYIVHHTVAKTLDELKPLCMSKYVQSHIGNTYVDIKKYLKDGFEVCFCGTPCQCSGLKNYLGKDYDKLIIVDLVCHGVPSQKVWKKYVAAMTERYGAYRFEFRNKDFGYNNSGMMIETSNEKLYANKTQANDIRFMSKAFFEHIDIRPSCHDCKFKDTARISDITIGDLWHIDKYSKEMNDNKGTTFVAVHTSKGMHIIDSLNNVKLININFKDYLKDDGVSMINSMSSHPKRQIFFEKLDNEDIDQLFSEFLITKENKSKEKLKSLLSALGVLHLVQRLNYKRKQYMYRKNLK